MTPPERNVAGSTPKSTNAAPAVSFLTLQKRADFLRASRAKWTATKGLTLQARKRSSTEPAPQVIRVGFTCSKKLGNAVTRNRAKRRLREAARTVLPKCGRPGYDYVLIGRAGATIDRPFDALCKDLRQALHKLHA